MAIYALGDRAPRLPEPGSFWVAPDARVIGDVSLGRGVGVWFGAVLRGDNEPISIGENTNLQEGVICHTDLGFPLTIGRGCTIGHHAIVHGCTLADNVLVGMGSTVMNGARIGRNCLIGAGALVTEGKIFAEGSLIVGNPAKVLRILDEDAIGTLRASATRYVAAWRRFSGELRRLD